MADNDSVEHYKFHHVDVIKCSVCRDFSCEEACFRGIYDVINKDTNPKCVLVEDKEDKCVKCHMCTTACKSEALTID